MQIDNIDVTSELGNVWLSFQYVRDFFENSDIGDISDLHMADIGTNKGTLPFLIKSNLGIEMEGYDLNANAIMEGKRIYPQVRDALQVTDAMLSGVADESYDIITMFDVIEHIPNIEEYMKTVYRKLKMGGY